MADWEEAIDKQLDGWLLYNSTKGQRFLDMFLRDVENKRPEAVPNTRLLLQSMPKHLWRADPIYVTTDMMTLLEAAWPTYEPEPLYPEDLIVPSGFVWLPRPVYTTDVRGIPMAHRAILWGPATSSDGHPGVFLATFCDPSDRDPGAVEDGMDIEDYRRAAMRVFGGAPMLGHATCRWFGKDYQHQEGEDIVVGIRDEDIDPVQAKQSQAEIEQFLGAMWRLLSQRIAVGMRATPSRAQRKRAWPHQFEPKYITVITLRRPKTAPGDEHHAVDWTHRWIVGAHWRWQPYPSEGIRRQIWIAPYVKGPADLPLVVRGARVFTLRR